MVYPEKTCQECGRRWQPTTRYQASRNKTCSKKCANAATSRALAGRTKSSRKIRVKCPECGTAFLVYPRTLKRTKNPTCSRECNGKARGREWAKHGAKGRAAWTEASRVTYNEKMSGPKNPAWKGGVTYIQKKGNYAAIKYVRAPEWARPMARKDGYIMEHRLLMAQRIGRLMTRTEVVHHLDHDPTNNDPTNLELWPSNGSHKAAEFGRVVLGAANRWRRRSTPEI